MSETPQEQQQQQQQQPIVDLSDLQSQQQPLRSHTNPAGTLDPTSASAEAYGVTSAGFQPLPQAKCDHHSCKKCKHGKCKRKGKSSDKGLSPEELQSMLSKGQLSVVQVNSVWDACKLGSLSFLQQYLTQNPSVDVIHSFVSQPYVICFFFFLAQRA